MAVPCVAPEMTTASSAMATTSRTVSRLVMTTYCQKKRRAWVGRKGRNCRSTDTMRITVVTIPAHLRRRPRVARLSRP
jgi:hypothetical protein